jgi:NADPH-dependent curcumin reductase CurA
VSAASGSVGHIVAQIAKLRGCRVVGVTGSAAKCELLTGRLGFDAAVDHRSATFRDDFKAATPDGIDLYFDNTGGDILGAALRRMRPHGRIVCCGVVSQYDTVDPQSGPQAPGLARQQPSAGWRGSSLRLRRSLHRALSSCGRGSRAR